MTEEPEPALVKTEAVARLRAALAAGEGVTEAVRACWYCHPLFASVLMSESLRLVFGTGCDIRLVTAFVVRVREAEGGVPGGFPSREAEALIRACLGEVALLEAVHPGEVSYPELGIAILSMLFREWRPGPAEVASWFGHVESALQAMMEGAPGLGTGEEDWFAAGMHQSPFAVLPGDPMPQHEEG